MYARLVGGTCRPGTENLNLSEFIGWPRLSTIIGLGILIYAASVFSYAPGWWVLRFMLAVFSVMRKCLAFHLSLADALNFMPTVCFLVVRMCKLCIWCGGVVVWYRAVCSCMVWCGRVVVWW